MMLEKMKYLFHFPPCLILLSSIFFPSRIATVHWSIVLKFLIDDFIVCEVIVPAKHPLLIPTSCLAFGETSLANFQCGDWVWQNCS